MQAGVGQSGTHLGQHFPSGTTEFPERHIGMAHLTSEQSWTHLGQHSPSVATYFCPIGHGHI